MPRDLAASPRTQPLRADASAFQSAHACRRMAPGAIGRGAADLDRGAGPLADGAGTGHEPSRRGMHASSIPRMLKGVKHERHGIWI
jgi:hypothetical protein